MRREQLAQRTTGISLESLFAQLQEGAVEDLNLVLKGDVDGSVEAAISELSKIQHPEVRVSVIHSVVGGISENDVMLASASNAMVVGFNVRPNAEARSLAEREGVEIRTYRVIYQLTQDIEQALVGMLKPVSEERRWERPSTGAGQDLPYRPGPRSYVSSGVVRRGGSGSHRSRRRHHLRDKIDSLRRFKDDVREVTEGFECGIHLEGYEDVKEGDS